MEDICFSKKIYSLETVEGDHLQLGLVKELGARLLDETFEADSKVLHHQESSLLRFGLLVLLCPASVSWSGRHVLMEDHIQQLNHIIHAVLSLRIV